MAEITDKRVWTTLITNTAYLSGLLTLDHSLKQVNSKYKLVALYTDTFPIEGHKALDDRNIPKIKINYLLPTKSKDYSSDPRFYDCWSKLQPFSLTQFEKIVQLDSDMVVIKNMDELFEFDLISNKMIFGASHACVCNPMEFEHYPKDWVPSNCAFSNYGKDSIKDGVYIGPQPIDAKLKICNGGLQVVYPDKDNYELILKQLDDESSASYEFADQSLLSDVFDSNWLGLSYIYNYLKTLKKIHSNLDFDKVKNIHYILTPKPWDVSLINANNYSFKKKQGEFTDDTDTFKFWIDINTDRLKKEAEIGINDGF